MKTNSKYRRIKGFTLVELLVVVAIIVALAAVAGPNILRMKKKGDLAATTRSATNLGTAMMEFQMEYSSFPSDATAEAVISEKGDAKFKVNQLKGANANDYFRQLLANGYKSEEPFYAKAPYTKKPDNQRDGADGLAAGEVGYGYIMNGSDAISAEDPNLPMAVTPLFNASTKGEFDSSIYDGKAIMLCVDGSVKPLSIRDDKKANLGKKSLLETGDKSYWGADIKPVIKPPKKNK